MGLNQQKGWDITEKGRYVLKIQFTLFPKKTENRIRLLSILWDLQERCEGRSMP